MPHVDFENPAWMYGGLRTVGLDLVTPPNGIVVPNCSARLNPFLWAYQSSCLQKFHPQTGEPAFIPGTFELITEIAQNFADGASPDEEIAQDIGTSPPARDFYNGNFFLYYRGNCVWTSNEKARRWKPENYPISLRVVPDDQPEETTTPRFRLEMFPTTLTLAMNWTYVSPFGPASNQYNSLGLADPSMTRGPSVFDYHFSFDPDNWPTVPADDDLAFALWNAPFNPSNPWPAKLMWGDYFEDDEGDVFGEPYSYPQVRFAKIKPVIGNGNIIISSDE